MTDCVCKEPTPGDACTPRGMEALGLVSEGMLLRLKKMIEKGYEYFTLSGSDPRQEDGCCPSDDVGAANMLVSAGVLDSWEKPVPEGGCTFTVYAFHGEMDTTGSQPTYTLNHGLRMQVLDRIGRSHAGCRNGAVNGDGVL